MLSKADKFCSSEMYGESFFYSSESIVYAYMLCDEALGTAMMVAVHVVTACVCFFASFLGRAFVLHSPLSSRLRQLGVMRDDCKCGRAFVRGCHREIIQIKRV
jgi:hypothetical protein